MQIDRDLFSFIYMHENEVRIGRLRIAWTVRPNIILIILHTYGRAFEINKIKARVLAAFVRPLLLNSP